MWTYWFDEALRDEVYRVSSRSILFGSWSFSSLGKAAIEGVFSMTTM
jgi:hypothetical protein